MDAIPERRAAEADIALLLEGTYPFVRGGVASWTDQLIRAFPEYRFAVIFLGGTPDQYKGLQYELPDNVVYLEAVFVHGPQEKPPVESLRGDPVLMALMKDLHASFKDLGPKLFGDRPIDTMFPMLLSDHREIHRQFLYSERSWEYQRELYQSKCPDTSFVDYFWTVRSMHQPIWVLAGLAERMIPARAYHSISTGYAGFLGALLRHRTNRPFILTEHGIYTKERRIDLFKAQWQAHKEFATDAEIAASSYLRDLWVRFFEVLGKLTYDVADPILSIFEVNRRVQMRDGAAAERTRVIPNGIDVTRLSALRAKRPAAPPPILCLLGRVVPIKDTSTFIRAMRTVVNRLPQAEGWIVGTIEEDREYAEECQHLVETLGLTGKVKFLGHQKVDDILPKIGLLVLSSISEGLPLVILEGFAAGVPAVSTDVGACRQLIHGMEEEEDDAGSAGEVVGLANPSALAEAALRLLTDPAKWRAAQAVAIRRVEALYSEERMIASYRAVYEEALASWPASALSSGKS
jgi:glycosyltransferase involved in cell wall biosynthesis